MHDRSQGYILHIVYYTNFCRMIRDRFNGANLGEKCSIIRS